MKRDSDPENEPDSKRIKLSHSIDFDNPLLERLPHEFDKDGLGFFSGRVTMVLPPTKDIRLKFQCDDDKDLPQFFIVFTDKCAELLKNLEFVPRDEISFDLHGSKVHRKSETNLALIYARGVSLKFHRRVRNEKDNGRIYHFWPKKRPDYDSPNADWFGTPTAQASTAASISAPVTSRHAGSASTSSDSVSDSEGDLQNSHSISAPLPAPASNAVPPTKKLSKKERKALRSKEHRKQQQQPGKDAGCSTDDRPPVAKNSSPPIKQQDADDVVLPTESKPIFKNPLDVSHNALLDMPPPPTGYRSLDAIKAPSQFLMLVGVVHEFTEPNRTINGDLGSTLKLTDPSLCNERDMSLLSPKVFKVNCFTKRYPEWLPQVKLGDILILRNVKSSRFPNGDIGGVGYSDKLQWAIYDPQKSILHHGTRRASVPFQEGLAERGGGYPFSPFYQSPPQNVGRELAYSKKLHDWMKEVERERILARGDEEVVMVGGGSYASEVYVRRGRQHRLIRDASPHTEPDGYFDCTVEILHGHDHGGGGIYSLYVTDYTVNESITPIKGDWCPPELGSAVLKIEMWDEAALMGPTMRVGTFYSMKNVRMRVSRGGYLEGKIVQSKIHLVDERDAEYNCNVRDLLTRKKEWEEEKGTSNDSIEYQLLRDFVPREPSNCLVEVLHSVHTDDEDCLYVTDYTAHPDLKNTSFSGEWAAGLEGLIVKVKLSDETQIGLGRLLENGSICTIRKLMLKTKSDNLFQGSIGGTQRLILKHSNDVSMHEDARRGLEALRRRKARCQRASVLPKFEYATVEDIIDAKDSTLPRIFTIRARVVDIQPPLEDVAFARCGHCARKLPPRERACIVCNDFGHKYLEHHFRLFLRVQDENHKDFAIEVNEASTLLKHIKPVNLQDNPRALQQIRDAVESITYPGFPKPSPLETVPVMAFTVVCWRTDNKRLVDLMSCNDCP